MEARSTWPRAQAAQAEEDTSFYTHKKKLVNLLVLDKERQHMDNSIVCSEGQQ
jgi:hypothetical protein